MSFIEFEKEKGELDEEIDGLMYERTTYKDELKNYMQELNNDVGKIIQLNVKYNRKYRYKWNNSKINL